MHVAGKVTAFYVEPGGGRGDKTMHMHMQDATATGHLLEKRHSWT